MPTATRKRKSKANLKVVEEEPQEEWVARWSCQVWGHHWNWANMHKVGTVGKQSTLWVACTECPTWKTVDLYGSGHVASTRYHYPEGYLRKGSQSGTEIASKQELRAAIVQDLPMSGENVWDLAEAATS